MHVQSCRFAVPVAVAVLFFKLSRNMYTSVIQVIRLAMTTLNILLLGRLHQKHVWQMQQSTGSNP